MNLRREVVIAASVSFVWTLGWGLVSWWTHWNTKWALLVLIGLAIFVEFRTRSRAAFGLLACGAGFFWALAALLPLHLDRVTNTGAAWGVPLMALTLSYATVFSVRRAEQGELELAHFKDVVGAQESAQAFADRTKDMTVDERSAAYEQWLHPPEVEAMLAEQRASRRKILQWGIPALVALAVFVLVLEFVSR